MKKIEKLTEEERLNLQIRNDTIYGPKSKFKLRGLICPKQPLPVGLFQVKSLRVLDMTAQLVLGVKLSKFPFQVCQLTQLRVLNLDLNSIPSLPDEIGNLRHLEILTLGYNKLSSLPDTLVYMNDLQSIHLSGNKFETFPEVLCSLSRLSFLDLSANKLQTLPKSIAKLWRTLETFIVTNNELEYIPEELCDCVNLQTLWLGNNRLTHLPNSFPKLTKLDWNQRPLFSSCIMGNEGMVFPPLFVCKNGLKEIVRYIRKNQVDADSIVDAGD